MRRTLRLALLAGAVLAGVTCTDAPTAPLSPASSTARLALAPSFTERAVRAWQSLAAFNLEANNVRIVLKRPGPPEVILKDVVVPLAPGQTEISLELEVTILGASEQLAAQVQVRDGDRVLFEGSSTVVAVRNGTTGGGTTGGGTGTISVDYVGPGARATSLRIAPRDQSVPTGATIAFSAQAFDASNQLVNDAVITWTPSDPTAATIDKTTGAFTAGAKRAKVQVIATLPSGIFDAVNVSIVPPAQKIVTVSGGGQAARAGDALAQPLVVEVRAADDIGVEGTTVAFTASEGASVTPATAVTDATGRASATMTLGQAAGTYTFTATAGTLGSTSVTATATPAPAAAIAVLSGGNQSGAVRTAAAQPLVVRVTDRFGIPVANATVTWNATAGSLANTSSTTGAEGTAQNAYTYGNTPGSATVTASVSTGTGDATASAAFTFTATPAAVAGLVIVSGDAQSGDANAVLQPFVVKATDAAGNPAPGFTISWTTTDGSISPAQSVTGADGTASAQLTLGTTAGPVRVTATAPATGTTPGASVSFTATTRPGAPATLVKQAGDAQSATAGTAVAIAPSVKLTDAHGNAIASAVVTFTVASGGGTVTGASASTDANGIATVGSWTLGAAAGANTLTATSGSLTTTFTATATSPSGPPANLVAVNGPTFSYVAGATVTAWPQVKVTDASGVAVSGAQVDVSVVDPSEATQQFSVFTGANGVADLHPATVTGFNGAGSYAMTITAPAVAGTIVNYNITVTPGALAGLTIVTNPSTSAALDALLSQQPVVRAVDAQGNGIAGTAVTAAVVAGGGTFTTASTTTVTTDASGFATFTNLAFATGSGTQEIAFSAGAFMSAHSPITILANAPAITALSVSPTAMVFGGTGSFTATLANGTAAPYAGLILQGYILQGAQLQVAAGGTTLSCNGTGAAGELPVGGGCNATFSFTVPSQALGLMGGPATYVLELRDGAGAILASASTPIALSTTPPAGTTRIFSGVVSRDWNDANNWSPAGVPTAADNVWLPDQSSMPGLVAGGMQASSAMIGVTLSANAIVGEIHTPMYGMGIDVGAFQLEVAGAALDLSGASVSSSPHTGSVKLSGANPLLNVYELPSTIVMNGARVVEYGYPWVNGNLDVLGGTFAIDGSSYLTVAGTLRIDGASAALRMAGNLASGSDVTVYGDFIANGAASDTTLVGGYLYVQGSFRQQSGHSTKSFAPQAELYVSLQPSAEAHVSFASPADSKFQDLDISRRTADYLRAAPSAAAKAVPPRVAAMRAAIARREAAAPERLRIRRAQRQAATPGALAALVANPGTNFETGANVAHYLYLNGPLAVLTSGATVTADSMVVYDNAAFDIAAGASLTVTSGCVYVTSVQVPAGICPNPQYSGVTMEPADNLSDVFVPPNQSLPANFGVRLLDNSPTPAPVAGQQVWFSVNGDGDACTTTSTDPVTTDAGGIARAPVTVTGRGSCVIYAYNGDESASTQLRVYAIPVPPVGGANRVFVGLGTGAWNDANSWVDPATTTFGVPQAGDRAVVTYAGTTRRSLTLTAPTTAGKVWMTPSGNIDLNGQVLTVTDSITGGGAVYGMANSRLVLAGTNQVIGITTSGIPMDFGTVGCSGQSFRLANGVTGGDVTVRCPLDLAGWSLTATGTFATAGNGALTMGSETSLYVAGDATFGGAAGNITGGTMIFMRNLTINGTSSLVAPQAVTVNIMAGDVAQAIAFPATANSNSLGVLQVNNRVGVQVSGTGSVPGNLYLYAGSTAADATKVTIASGASLAVGTRVDVNQYANLTVNGSLNTPILSLGTGATVVANGPITGVAAGSCSAIAGQVTGTGKPATCP